MLIILQQIYSEGLWYIHPRAKFKIERQLPKVVLGGQHQYGGTYYNVNDPVNNYLKMDFPRASLNDINDDE